MRGLRVAVVALMVGLATAGRPAAPSRAGGPAPLPPIAPLGFEVKFVHVLPDADPYRTLAYRTTVHRHRQHSPDGRSTLTVRFTSCGQPTICSFLWLERAGQPPKLLHREASWVQWNRKGTGFAFVGRRTLDRAYPRSLYVYTLEPLRALRRIDVDPIDYGWSPLGGTLAIAGRAPAGGIPEHRQPIELFVAPAHGAALRPVARVRPRPDPRSPGSSWTPEIPGFSWSPDGRFLVYSLVQDAASEGETYAADLYVATADGSLRQQLTKTPHIVETWPRWVTSDQIVALRTHVRRASLPQRGPRAFETEKREGAVLNLVVPR